MSDLFDACPETRFFASVELDEELSELDAARLRAHLESCPACALWAAQAGALTVLLREAEQEKPAPMLSMPARRVNFRHSGAVAGAVASAAAVALAAIAVTFPPAAPHPGSESLGEDSALSGPTCSACDVARAFVPANFASATAPVAPRVRRHPEPT